MSRPELSPFLKQAVQAPQPVAPVAPPIEMVITPTTIGAGQSPDGKQRILQFTQPPFVFVVRMMDEDWRNLLSNMSGVVLPG